MIKVLKTFAFLWYYQENKFMDLIKLLMDLRKNRISLNFEYNSLEWLWMQSCPCI
jgi:hypothetical protein